MATKTLDTPVTPDTPASATPSSAVETQVVTPPDAGTPTLSDVESMLQDLKGDEGVKAPVVEQKKDDETQDDDEDTSSPMFRKDYLKRLNKIKEQETALLEKEKALQAEREKLEAGRDQGDKSKSGDKDQSQGIPRFSLGIDPEKYEYPQDKEFAGAFGHVEAEINKMREALLTMYRGMSGIAANERASQATQVAGVMDKAAASISRKWGVEATAEDVGEAIMNYGQPLVKKYGGVTEEMAMDAWSRANVDVLLAAMQPDESKGPVRSAPQIATNGIPRSNVAPRTDDERMLQDLGLG